MWNLLKGNNKDTRTTWFLTDFIDCYSVSKIDFEQVVESWECAKRNSSIIFTNPFLPYFDSEGSIFQEVCKGGGWGLPQGELEIEEMGEVTFCWAGG